MGLSVEVGYLSDLLSADEDGAKSFLEEIAVLNTYLSSCGLVPHQEPESCEVYSADMFGYSGLHYLRRIAAHLELRGKLPEPGDRDASKDPVLENYFDLVNSSRKRGYDHLIYHSDAEGFYLPQQFDTVRFPPEELKIPGGMLGSSPQLLAEMKRLAQALQLPLDLDPEAEEVWEAADSQGEGDLMWQRYGVESFICLRLFHAAQHSIANSALIVFT